MKISLIAAVADGNVIGSNGALPWKISADLKRFRELTTGHVILMGRKTFESIGKPLPNRTNIVISSNPDFHPDGCTICHTIDEGIQKAQELGEEELFVVGGGTIYSQTIERADRLYMTKVHRVYDGDTVFPDYTSFGHVVSREPHTEPDGLAYEFLVLEK